MTYLLIIGLLALAFGVAFGLTDRPADDDTDDFTQPTYVRLLADKDHA